MTAELRPGEGYKRGESDDQKPTPKVWRQSLDERVARNFALPAEHGGVHSSLPLSFCICGQANPPLYQQINLASYGSLVWFLGEHFVHYGPQIEKDGLGLLAAKFQLGYRANSDVTEVTLLVYDIDYVPAHELRAMIVAAGLAAVAYSTFNHLSMQSSVSPRAYDKWRQKAGAPEVPTQESFVAFLESEKKTRGYTGVRLRLELGAYIFDHDPVHKSRVIFPLAEPIIFRTWDGFGLAHYAPLYKKIGSDVFHGRFDESCSDPSRIQYLPAWTLANPYHSERWFETFPGTLLDWRAYWTPEEREKVTRAVAAKAARRAANIGHCEGTYGERGEAVPARLIESIVGLTLKPLVEGLHLEELDAREGSRIPGEPLLMHCFNWQNHTGRKTTRSEATLYDPNIDEGYRSPYYSCKHDGCADLNVWDFIDWLIDEATDDTLTREQVFENPDLRLKIREMGEVDFDRAIDL